MSREFKVGDRARVRAWDDMAEEFGVDSSGDIKTFPRFVKNMRHFCGQTATIAGVSATHVTLKGWIGGPDINWNFSTDTLELAELSYMEQVVKMFGVELGEEFEIGDTSYNPYKFTENGLCDRDDDISSEILQLLLTGSSKIQKSTCACCGGTKEVVKVADIQICTQCARDVLDAWERKKTASCINS